MATALADEMTASYAVQRTGIALLDRNLDAIAAWIAHAGAGDLGSRLFDGSVVWDPSSVPGTSHIDQMFTGADSPPIGTLKTTDFAAVMAPASLPDGMNAMALVLKAGQLTIRLFNYNASAVDPPSGTWRYMALRAQS